MIEVFGGLSERAGGLNMGRRRINKRVPECSGVPWECARR